MRGNHETCNRNPVGWFTSLLPRRYQGACQRFTEPYITSLHVLSFAVIDSAEAANESHTARDRGVRPSVRPAGGDTAVGSWLVTHRPAWRILEGKEGEFDVENASYAAGS